MKEDNFIYELKKSFKNWDKYGSIILIHDANSFIRLESKSAFRIAKLINESTYKNKMYKIKSFRDVEKKMLFSRDKQHSFFVDLTSKGWMLDNPSTRDMAIARMAKSFFLIARSHKRTLYVFTNGKSESIFKIPVEMNCNVQLVNNSMGQIKVVLNSYNK